MYCFLARSDTYQRVLSVHHVAGERLSVLVNERELASDLGLSNTLGSIGNTLALHAALFMLKVPNQSTTSNDEEDTCFPGKWLQNFR